VDLIIFVQAMASLKARRVVSFVTDKGSPIVGSLSFRACPAQDAETRASLGITERVARPNLPDCHGIVTNYNDWSLTATSDYDKESKMHWTTPYYFSKKELEALLKE
jgi:hypothetical protein